MDLFEQVTGRKLECTPLEAANFIKAVNKYVPPMTKEEALRFYDAMVKVVEAARGE